MPKYQNSIIYKLCHQNDLNNENIYIGSTTNFRTRKNKHKLRTTKKDTDGYNIFVYQFIRDNGGWDEWQMIPIEVFPCNNKDELKIRERYHIELLKSKLNKNIPTRTDKEYRNDNKKKIAEYKNNNKERIAETNKKWREANKEHKAETDKKYYEVNKEIINEKLKEKVVCEYCGCESTKGHLKRHQKSKKCLKKQNII